MPGMNGIEVGREIRRSSSKVLLILFTLHAGPVVERMAAEAGFDSVLSKGAPFPIVAIIERMQNDLSRENGRPDHNNDGNTRKVPQ